MLLQRTSLLIAALLATACHSSSTDPAGSADASGVVLEIMAAPVPGSAPTSLLVEHRGRPSPADRSVVHLRADTEILVRSSSGATRQGQVSDIRVGAEASITTTGVELRSYPRQVYATRIVVPAPGQ